MSTERYITLQFLQPTPGEGEFPLLKNSRMKKQVKRYLSVSRSWDVCTFLVRSWFSFIWTFAGACGCHVLFMHDILLEDVCVLCICFLSINIFYIWNHKRTSLDPNREEMIPIHYSYLRARCNPHASRSGLRENMECMWLVEKVACWRGCRWCQANDLWIQIMAEITVL